VRFLNLTSNKISFGDRHRRELGDLKPLTESIKAIGLLHPIVLTQDHRLVAGQRRLEAVKQLGWTSVPIHVVSTLADASQILIAERDENTRRKRLTISEAVSVGRKLEELFKPEAERRKRATQPKKGEKVGEAQGAGNLPEPKGAKGDTRDKVGEAVDMSGKTYEKAKAVVEAAETEPELFDDLVLLMDEKDKVEPVYREMKRRKKDGKKEKPPKQPWSIDYDVAKFTALVRKCRRNWTADEDLRKIRDFFTRTVSELGDSNLANRGPQ
jgi:ParB-like chromosome segregation protein Spo0J